MRQLSCSKKVGMEEAPQAVYKPEAQAAQNTYG
jgi:hypothetical protein